jgi:hypothetical protein
VFTAWYALSRYIKQIRFVFKGLIPLTEQLNRLNTGYEVHTTKTKIPHLLHMDDLKLLGKSEEEFKKQIQTVTTFNDGIHMESGLDKCAKVVFKKGNLIR